MLALAAVRDADGFIRDFDIVDANPRAASMVDMPRDDLVGHRICEVFPLNRMAGHFGRWDEVTTSKATLEWEFESMDPRVGPKWVRCQAVPLDDGVALSLRDVTAQKTAESELDELTQLPNRRAFRRMVAQELKTGPRAGRRGAAL